MKKTLVVVLALVMALSFVACKKESAAPITNGGQPQPGLAPTGSPEMPAVPTERTLVVPDEVKAKWSSIVLNVQDKATGTTTEQTVALGAEVTITGTDIKVKAEAFLPDFIMQGGTITTRSQDANNPAAKIVVTEGGEELFNSWIYANHPSIHPFQHEKYGISLKEAK